MSAIRTLSKHARSLSHSVIIPKQAGTRAFHSPFAALSTPMVHSQPQTHTSPLYEKQLDHSPEPSLSSNGSQTYVVSEPDPSQTPYEVPYGAYPTSAPYTNFAATEKPSSEGKRYSSTSSSFAHPLTRLAPQNESGVGESSAVRNAEAPGEMHTRGGSNGGLGLMDREGSKLENGLADRNPPPLHETAEKFSKAGLDGAWKLRK